MRIIVIILALMMSSSTYGTELFVAPDGNDANPGTKDKPFKTIEHARQSVAKINGDMTGDITVYLRGGIYELSASVVFSGKDSGTNGHKIIYKSLPGETPIVSGGRVIKGWSIHDKDKGIYKASVRDLEFRQLYVNGVRAIRARYPDKTSDVTLEGFLGGANVTGSKPHQLKVNPAELAGWEKWTNLNEVEVVMLTHWKQKRARIAGIEGGTISFQEPENTARAMHHMEQPGTPHWYENAYEFLDAEGEFYLNTKQDVLYYKPRKGEDMTSAEVMAPTVETLFDIKGGLPDGTVHDLVFEGLTFEYSQWTQPSHKGYTVMQSATHYSSMAAHFDDKAPVPGAVQIQNAQRVEIRDCTVRKTSAHGIVAIRDVVSDCSIVGNYVTDVAAGGIYLLLNDEKSTGNWITDNTVELVGRTYSDGCGILVTRTPDVSILHNEIRDVRYTGISTGWAWDDKNTAAKNHEVGFNLIHRVMGLHDDGGGIYTLGKIEGMKIHHNYIHSATRSKFAGSYGICGIYLDNGSCFKHVHDNVIADIEAAFFSGNKPNYRNVFENNFYNTRLATVIEKENTVRDNTQVKGSDWPEQAREIMGKAGPRGEHRRPR